VGYSTPICANMSETVLVLLINEHGEKEKGSNEREFSDRSGIAYSSIA
jgi:hypothetical protein